MAKFTFDPMIEKLKKAPKTIVFTEGTDPRILEAASRLLMDGFLTPILVGEPAAVKAAADKAGFDVSRARVVDPTASRSRITAQLLRR